MTVSLELITKKSSKKTNNTPILFVHGAWQGAWCWEYFMTFFSKKGYDCYAPSLQGHGESDNNKSLKFTRIDDYVANIREVVDSIEKDTEKKPFIVAHSMGGLIIQKYLENDYDIPKAILLTPVPRHGIWQATLRTFRRVPIQFLKLNMTLSLWPLINTKERARKILFSDDIDEKLLAKYFKRLQDEAYLGFLDMLIFRLPSPKKVKTPVTIIGAEKDALFSVKEIEATARAYGTEAYIFENIAHNMMLEKNWKDVAEFILNVISDA
jgi:pimeloyl-ACP methyl ester carboxylesterase